MIAGNDKKPSHGICDDCLKEHYPKIYAKKRDKSWTGKKEYLLKA